jgi:hypothetical protein
VTSAGAVPDGVSLRCLIVAELSFAGRVNVTHAVASQKWPLSAIAVAACAAFGVATAAVAGAPHVVAVLDGVQNITEPIARYGGDYLSGSPQRLFVRPVEYYLNLWAIRSGAPWLVLMVVVLASAGFAVAISRLAHPDDAGDAPYWRWLTAALVFSHPLILPTGYEYDRVSQVLANLLGALALLSAVRRPEAVARLLAVHVLGLAAKESYLTFALLSSGWAAVHLWRQRAYPRLIWLVVGCAVVLAGYRWLHLELTNEVLLAATRRYQLHLGVNVLQNFGLFVAGTLFLGSTARAAQGLSLSVVAWVVVSASLWLAWLHVVVRATRARTAFSPEFLKGLAPLLLGLGASLLPSILTRDISENNASCFAACAVALAVALLRRSLPPETSRQEGAGFRDVAVLATAIACVSCATGSLDKLERIRVTSADSTFMLAQALRQAGQGSIVVDCRYVPKRRYSVYHLPSAAQVDWLNRYLVARGQLAPTDVLSCASAGSPVSRAPVNSR